MQFMTTFCQLSARLRIVRDDPPPGGIGTDGFGLKMTNLGVDIKLTENTKAIYVNFLSTFRKA